MRILCLLGIIASALALAVTSPNAGSSQEPKPHDQISLGGAVEQVVLPHPDYLGIRSWIKQLLLELDWRADEAIHVAQNDLSFTGNPAVIPLKWSGLLVNYFEKDGTKWTGKCTGQFISETVVLTAAHCVQDTETGDWYDLNKMYFLLQYQNDFLSQQYRPVCLSRFDNFMPRPRNVSGGAALVEGIPWDYAMILMDRPSLTGHYNWTVDWAGKFTVATATGYPSAALAGEVIQKAHGILQRLSEASNVLALQHNDKDLTQGSSGGAWVANFGLTEGADNNIVIGLNSVVNKNLSGVSYGPYFTADFNRLFDYVSKGCPR
jgi:hypothetical protein